MTCPTDPSSCICPHWTLRSLVWASIPPCHILLISSFWLYGSFMYFLALQRPSLLSLVLHLPPLFHHTPYHTHNSVQLGQCLTHFFCWSSQHFHEVAKQELSLVPFYGWQNWGSEKLSALAPDLSKWYTQDSEQAFFPQVKPFTTTLRWIQDCYITKDLSLVHSM